MVNRAEAPFYKFLQSTLMIQGKSHFRLNALNGSTGNIKLARTALKTISLDSCAPSSMRYSWLLPGGFVAFTCYF